MTFRDLVSDTRFFGLPPEEREKAIKRFAPSFSNLPDGERAKFMDALERRFRVVGAEQTGLPGAPGPVVPAPRLEGPAVDLLRTPQEAALIQTPEQLQRQGREPGLVDQAALFAGPFSRAFFGTATQFGNFIESTRDDKQSGDGIGVGQIIASIGRTAENLAFQPDPTDGKDFIDDPSKLTDPAYLVELFGSAGGSAAGFILPGVGQAGAINKTLAALKATERVRRIAGTAGAAGASGVLEGFVSAGAAFEESLELGADEETAALVAADVAKKTIPTNILLNAGGVFNDSIKSGVRRAVATVITEEIQEGQDNLQTNVAIRDRVDPNRRLSQGAVEAAIGGLGAAGVGGVIERATRSRRLGTKDDGAPVDVAPSPAPTGTLAGDDAQLAAEADAEARATLDSRADPGLVEPPAPPDVGVEPTAEELNELDRRAEAARRPAEQTPAPTAESRTEESAAPPVETRSESEAAEDAAPPPRRVRDDFAIPPDEQAELDSRAEAERDFEAAENENQDIEATAPPVEPPPPRADPKVEEARSGVERLRAARERARAAREAPVGFQPGESVEFRTPAGQRSGEVVADDGNFVRVRQTEDGATVRVSKLAVLKRGPAVAFGARRESVPRKNPENMNLDEIRREFGRPSRFNASVDLSPSQLSGLSERERGRLRRSSDRLVDTDNAGPFERSVIRRFEEGKFTLDDPAVSFDARRVVNDHLEQKAAADERQARAALIIGGVDDVEVGQRVVQPVLGAEATVIRKFGKQIRVRFDKEIPGVGLETTSPPHTFRRVGTAASADSATPPVQAETPQAARKKKLGADPASKLRKAAESARRKAADLQGSGVFSQRPTQRRAGIADSITRRAEREERLARSMDLLADARDAGTLPTSLAGLDSRAAVEQIDRFAVNSQPQLGDGGSAIPAREPTLPRQRILPRDRAALLEAARGLRAAPGSRDIELARATVAVIGPDVDRLTPVQASAVVELNAAVKRAGRGDPLANSSFNSALAARNRLVRIGIKSDAALRKAVEDFRRVTDAATDVSPEKARTTKVRKLERDLVGSKIPGFFPTPKPVIDEVLSRANITPGSQVLEPSAGKGDLAEAARDAGASVETFEVSGQLQEILRAKGFEPGGDFLVEAPKTPPDRIVMNPPFERGQDIDHVRRAFDVLAPGGRLVSVMSAGTFSRQDKKSVAFRAFLEEVGGTAEALPANSFAGAESFRQTGVNAQLVTIDKPGGETAVEPNAAPIEEETGSAPIDGIFRDAKQRDEATPAVREKIERLAPSVDRVRGRVDWNLVPSIQGALDVLAERKTDLASAKAPPRGDAAREAAIDAETMADALESLDADALAQRGQLYAQDAALSGPGATRPLFGEPPSQADAFANAFGPRVTDDAKLRRSKKVQPPERSGNAGFVSLDFLTTLFRRRGENAQRASKRPEVQRLTREERKQLFAAARKIDLPDAAFKAVLKRVTGRESTALLSRDQHAELLTLLATEDANGRPVLQAGLPSPVADWINSPSFVLSRSRAGQRIFESAESEFFREEQIIDRQSRVFRSIIKGVSKTDLDAITSFRLGLDAQGEFAATDRPGDVVTLTPEQRVVNDKLNAWYNRMFQAGVREGFVEPSQQIDNYLAFYQDDFFGGKPDAKLAEAAANLAAERGIPVAAAEQIMRDAQARNVKFGSFDFRRSAAATPGLRDIRLLSDIYVKGFARKVTISKFLKDTEPLLDEIGDKGLRQYAFDYRNQYAGRPTESLIDSWIAASPRLRETRLTRARIVGALTSAQFMSKIGLNLFTPLLNLTQNLNTVAKVGGVRTAVAFARGVTAISLPASLNPLSRDMARLRKSGILESIGNKFERPELTGANKQLQDSMSAAFDKSEQINRSTAFIAGYQLARDQGKSESEAVLAGRELVRITQFFSGRLDAPLITRMVPETKLLLQFKTFTFKEVEFLSKLDRREQARFAAATVALGGPAAFGISQAVAFFFPGSDLDKLLERWNESFNVAALLQADNIARQLGIFIVPGVEDLGAFNFKDRLLRWAAGPTLNSMMDLAQAASRLDDPNYGERLITAAVRGWVPGGAELRRVKRAMDEAQDPQDAIRILLNLAYRERGKSVPPEVREILREIDFKVK